MRKSPATPVDRTSQTFNDASDIIGSGKSSAVPPPPATRGVHNIDITPADNGGVSVTHSMKKAPKAGNEWDTSGPRQTNVFSTPHEAHTHIGHLLGVHGPHSGGSGGLT